MVCACARVRACVGGVEGPIHLHNEWLQHPALNVQQVVKVLVWRLSRSCTHHCLFLLFYVSHGHAVTQTDIRQATEFKSAASEHEVAVQACTPPHPPFPQSSHTRDPTHPGSSTPAAAWHAATRCSRQSWI
jgi:hypothetical protein